MMEQQAVLTSQAPRPLGPYSQAIILGGFVFASGQIGLDPATGKMTSEDVAGQTRQALGNMAAVLAESGSSLQQVLKTTVFLADLDDFAAMNAVYAECFATQTPPARSTIQVGRLPAGALVEIEAIAFIPGAAGGF
jgi:2-iminobutanoate/2-iminopropanoate deaminase